MSGNESMMDQTTNQRTSEPDPRRFRQVFDLREWARVCSAQFWWIVIITAAIFTGTAIAALTATSYFRATQRILIERKSDRIVGIDETYDLGSADSDFYLTHYKLLESRAVAETALALLPEADRQWFGRKGDPVEHFIRLVRIVPIRKSRLVDIQAEHPHPKIAEFMVDAILRAYRRNNEERRRKSAEHATASLRRDARSLQEKLLEARRASQEYRSEHGILSVDDRQTLPEFRLQSLNHELAELERKLADSDARLAIANEAVKNADFTGDLPEVLQNRLVTEYKMVYLESKATLSRLGEKWGQRHPRILEEQSRVDAIAQQIDREVKAVVGALRHENAGFHAYKANLEARIAAQNKLLFEHDRARIRYDFLVEEAKRIQTLHDTITSRLKEVEAIADHSLANVHEIGSAVVSGDPIRPRPLAAVSIALLCGLMLSIITAFVLDALDNTIKSSSEAEHVLGAPVVGVVPRVRGASGRTSTDERSLDPGSNVAEAFRSLRTNLLLNSRGQRMNSLVVTSTGAGEGKSLVALNLATAFARAGHRVLLVDAEMRRPRLHHTLRVGHTEGFSSVLIDERKVEQVSFETDEDNLYFMPCGVLPPNPLELLTIGMSNRVRRDLAEFFDLVVFDSPPVGVVSDACMLASTADHVLFVVRSFAADRTRAQRALAQLRATGARIGGLIVNHVDSRAERGRRLDFTYDSGYSSMPAPIYDAPEAATSDPDAQYFEDEQLELQLVELEQELGNAISDLTRESRERTEEE